MNYRTRKMKPGTYVHEADVITKMVYMAHPVRGATKADTDENLRRARAWLKYLEAGNPWTVFVSQWILGCELWDDADPDHREQGLKRCLAQVERCDEIWLMGPRVSKGMLREVQCAHQFAVKVINFTGEGRELPPEAGSTGGRIIAP